MASGICTLSGRAFCNWNRRCSDLLPSSQAFLHRLNWRDGFAVQWHHSPTAARNVASHSEDYHSQGLPEQQARPTPALEFPRSSSQDPLPVQQAGPPSLLPTLSPGFSDSPSHFTASGPVSVSSPYLFSFFWTFSHLSSGQSQKMSMRKTPNRNWNQSQSITGILGTRYLIGRYGRC